MFFEAILDWHFGEIASCQPTMAEAISVAKELNNMQALTQALWHAGWLAHFQRDPAEVERLASLQATTPGSCSVALCPGAWIARKL